MKEIFLTTLVAVILPSVFTYIDGLAIISNGQINCGGLVCPANSVSCTVSKISFGDLTKYKSSKICFDSNGQPTANVTEVLVNPRPGLAINSISSVGSGPITDTSSDTEKKAIEATIEAEQNYWSKWSKNLTGDLKASFPFI